MSYENIFISNDQGRLSYYKSTRAQSCWILEGRFDIFTSKLAAHDKFASFCCTFRDSKFYRYYTIRGSSHSHIKTY